MRDCLSVCLSFTLTPTHIYIHIHPYLSRSFAILSVSLSLCLFLSLSICLCLSVCVCVSVFLCLSVSVFLSVSVCLSLSHSLSLCVYLYLGLSLVALCHKESLTYPYTSTNHHQIDTLTVHLPLKCSKKKKIGIIFKMKSLSNMIFKTKSNGIMFDRDFIFKMMTKKKEKVSS